jgi:signal transduction histidine kinase
VAERHPYASAKEHSLAVAAAPEVEFPVLDRIESLLRLRARLPAPTLESAAMARARAERLAATALDPQEANRLAALLFTSEALAASWLDRRWSQRDIDFVVEVLAEALGMDASSARLSVFLRATRDQHVLSLPAQLGAETLLLMLCTFTAATSASLWAASQDGGLSEMISTGDGESTRRTRAAAQEVLESGRPMTGARSQLHAVLVERWGRPAAALVVRCLPEARLVALAYAEETAIALAPLIEFDELLGRNVARERSLTDASERRLARIGFDLHDGPMQEIAALAADLRLFRSQLAPLLAESEHSPVVLGRVDDLEARLVSVDVELRELAISLQSPAALRIPVVEAIRLEIDRFRARSGIEAQFSTSGDFDALTASQRTALARIAQEALSNVQEHSGARSVKVQVTASRTRLGLEVVDDGQGFDVQQRLLDAARAGRLGLVGMGERVRLLGGRFELESRPGGPTRVRASLPRWRPLAQEASEDLPE